ncbi:MAG: ubiquitin-conjugating enzyme E2 [Thermoplasmata archaeon]|nr:ubiquitin-conjugating enzyme E2 [Thermoplasmata archaeon]
MNFERIEADYFEAVNEFEEDPYVDIRVWKGDNTVGHLEVVIAGAEGTPYAGGHYHFEIKMFSDYPFSPPGVFCHTPIWHPNIALNRKAPTKNSWRDNVCFDIIDPRRVGKIDPVTNTAGWTPTRDLTMLIEGLKLMIHMFPPFFNTDDPLNEDAAKQYVQDRDGFMENAREMNDRHAR